MTQAEFDELEAAASTPYGHCNEMGTASTMASLVEALGMCLPGTASIPAVDAARARAAEATGARAVELAREGLRPVADPDRRGVRQRDHAADGDRRRHERGHPPARARRPRRRAARRSTASTSSRGGRRVLANVRPSGEHLFEHLHRAGGVRAVLHELAPLLHGDALTVTGRTLARGVAGGPEAPTAT